MGTDESHPPRSCRRDCEVASPQETLNSYFNLLWTNRNYRLYLLSHICQHIGNWMVRIASLLLVERLAPESSTAISVLVLCSIVPKVFVTPLGGILADRFDKRWLMIILDSCSSIGVLSYIIAGRSGNILYLYGATVLRYTLDSIYEPIAGSIIPMFVDDPEDLKRIITLNGMAWAIMLMMGGVIAGDMSATLGVDACFAFDCVTFILSTIAMLGVRGNFKVSQGHNVSNIDADREKDFDRQPLLIRLRTKMRQMLQPLYSFFQMAGEFILYLWLCGFGLLTLMKASGMTAWGASDVLNVLLSQVPDDESESSRRLGILYSSEGIGNFLGPILANTFIVDGKKPHTMQLACIAGLALIMVAWIAVANAPTFEFVCIFATMRCIGGSIVWLNSTLLLQNLSDPEMLGRMLSFEHSLASALEGTSAFVAGRLEDKGYGKEEISFLSASAAGSLLIIWSTYHLFGYGAAKKRVTNSNNKMRGGSSFDLVHSPAQV